MRERTMHKPSTTTTSPLPRSNAPWVPAPASPTSKNFARNSGLPYLTFDALASLPFLRHAFTVRLAGVPVAPDVRRGKPITSTARSGPEPPPHVGGYLD